EVRGGKRLWKCRACGKRPRASLPSVAWKSQSKKRPDFPTFPQPLRLAIDQMKQAKNKNFNLPTTAASRHTTPLRGYFLSSRFICEATNQRSSRFYYEATGGQVENKDQDHDAHHGNHSGAG